MPFLSGLPCRLESTYRTHPPRRSRGEDIKVPGNERNIWAIINTLADWWFWGISPLLIGYSMTFHYEIWVLTLPKNMGLRYDITENDGWIGCYIGGEMHWGLWLLCTRPKSTNLIKELKEHVGVAETLLDLSTVPHQRLPPAVCVASKWRMRWLQVWELLPGCRPLALQGWHISGFLMTNGRPDDKKA